MKHLGRAIFVHLSLVASLTPAEEHIAPRGADPLTLKTANQILDGFEALYQPLAVQTGMRLNLKRELDSPIINASGNFDDESWIVTVYGGLINHPWLSPEAFVALICHEFGHALGGEPLISALVSGPMKASSGGQADYYAAAYCMKAYWKNEDNVSALQRLRVNDELTGPCQTRFDTEEKRALCGRILNAAQELGRFVAESTGEDLPVLSRKDRSIADKTLVNEHPPVQCRLDTFVAGALCQALPRGDKLNESAAVINACDQDHVSARPRCWFVSSFREGHPRRR